MVVLLFYGEKQQEVTHQTTLKIWSTLRLHIVPTLNHEVKLSKVKKTKQTNTLKDYLLSLQESSSREFRAWESIPGACPWKVLLDKCATALRRGGGVVVVRGRGG